MRDHAEPKRYYDWMVWKMRQEDEKEMLDSEYGWLLKLDRGGYLCKKYPDLQRVITEVLVAEKLMNERVPQLLGDHLYYEDVGLNDDIPF